MDRRELLALIGAGTLFPADFLKASIQPKKTGCLSGLRDDDHTQYYPIYYMKYDHPDVYQLWQPNIIMAVVHPGTHAVLHQSDPGSTGIRHIDFGPNLYNAIWRATPNSLIVDDARSFAFPYRHAPGSLVRVPQTRGVVPVYRPLLVSIDKVILSACKGQCIRIDPFCTYKEFRKEHGKRLNLLGITLGEKV